MKAIFASKMYAASKNKDKINAAINDPVNKELVLQLKEYLDDDSIEISKVKKAEPNQNNSDSHDDAHEGNEPNPSVDTNPIHFTPGGSAPVADNQLGEDVDDSDDGLAEEEDTTDDDELIDTSDDSDDDDDSIDSKTSTSGQRITASQSIEDIPSEIKGTLNMRSDTEGVSRVRVKDNELWVHYNDNVNLNNVMGPVIELLNAANYSYLEFNRLARTENAIVFEVSQIDTNNDVEPVGGSEE